MGKNKGMERIHLNISLDYAVRYEKDFIFREFIQNFYDTDSCGFKGFGKNFRFSYDGGSLTLRMQAEASFGLGWLRYFQALGIATIDSLCREAGGYSAEREPASSGTRTACRKLRYTCPVTAPQTGPQAACPRRNRICPRLDKVS